MRDANVILPAYCCSTQFVDRMGGHMEVRVPCGVLLVLSRILVFELRAMENVCSQPFN